MTVGESFAALARRAEGCVMRDIARDTWVDKALKSAKIARVGADFMDIIFKDGSQIAVQIDDRWRVFVDGVLVVDGAREVYHAKSA